MINKWLSRAGGRKKKKKRLKLCTTARRSVQKVNGKGSRELQGVKELKQFITVKKVISINIDVGTGWKEKKTFSFNKSYWLTWFLSSAKPIVYMQKQRKIDFVIKPIDPFTHPSIHH